MWLEWNGAVKYSQCSYELCTPPIKIYRSVYCCFQNWWIGQSAAAVTNKLVLMWNSRYDNKNLRADGCVRGNRSHYSNECVDFSGTAGNENNWRVAATETEKKSKWIADIVENENKPKICVHHCLYCERWGALAARCGISFWLPCDATVLF